MKAKVRLSMQRALELTQDEKMSGLGVTLFGVIAKPRSGGCLINKPFVVGQLVNQPESQPKPRKSGVLMMEFDLHVAFI